MKKYQVKIEAQNGKTAWINVATDDYGKVESIAKMIAFDEFGKIKVLEIMETATR